MNTFIIYPNTLFYDIKPMLSNYDLIYVVEDPTFFVSHNYHKLKLILHRSSMKYYKDYLSRSLKNVVYINFAEATNIWYKCLAKSELKLTIFDPLNKSLVDKLNKYFVDNLIVLSSPQFLTTKLQLDDYHTKHVHNNDYSFTKFYRWQRKRLGVLVNAKGKPSGGKWMYNSKRMLKYNKDDHYHIFDYNMKIDELVGDKYVNEAKRYVNHYFGGNYGSDKLFVYDYTPEMAKASFDSFLANRLHGYAKHNNSIEPDVDVGFHSMVSHALNIGIITPSYILEKTLLSKLPAKCIEYFVRQIIGRREYARFIYIYEGELLRNTNQWEATNKLSNYWWSNNKYMHKYILDVEDNSRDTLGVSNLFDERVMCAYLSHVILPLDVALGKVYNIAYASNEERFAIIGRLMFMLQVDPNEVYRWFMSCTIDAYDWVVVPNVYGVSQMSCASLKLCSKSMLYGKSDEISKLSSYSSKHSWAKQWDLIYYNFVLSKLGKYINPYKRYKLNQNKKAYDELLGKLIDNNY